MGTAAPHYTVCCVTVRLAAVATKLSSASQRSFAAEAVNDQEPACLAALEHGAGRITHTEQYQQQHHDVCNS